MNTDTYPIRDKLKKGSVWQNRGTGLKVRITNTLVDQPTNILFVCYNIITRDRRMSLKISIQTFHKMYKYVGD